MAYGIHWEWRGFGEVSDRFRTLFDSLQPLFSREEVTDTYVWVPKLQINLKLRAGNGDKDGLKFKRLKDEDGDLEQWEENREEMYEYPLVVEAWEKLGEELGKLNVGLPAMSREPLDREATLRLLRQADARVRLVEVTKRRKASLWSGPDGDVKVEIADISSPQTVSSVGLENWGELAAPDEAAKGTLLVASKALGTHKEPLTPMSYLQAVENWANGVEI